jgi:hypothetical protein
MFDIKFVYRLLYIDYMFLGNLQLSPIEILTVLLVFEVMQ